MVNLLVDSEAPRFFLDSSVIIAGSASEVGASSAILTMAELGLFRLVACPYVMEETERNLIKKLPKALKRYSQIQSKIPWEIVSDSSYEENSRWLSVLPEKDIPVLVAAINAKLNRLVTLDTLHFLDDFEVAQKSQLMICTPATILRDTRHALHNTFL